MGRGPDTKPRKLQWTAPMFVTEVEALSMGLSKEGVKSLEQVGSLSYPDSAPAKIYRYPDVERAIEAEGNVVNLSTLRGD